MPKEIKATLTLAILDLHNSAWGLASLIAEAATFVLLGDIPNRLGLLVGATWCYVCAL